MIISSSNQSIALRLQSATFPFCKVSYLVVHNVLTVRPYVLTAKAFLTAISRMPGQALPIVGESGRTLEYPAPLLTSYPAADRGSDSKVLIKGQTCIFWHYPSYSPYIVISGDNCPYEASNLAPLILSIPYLLTGDNITRPLLHITEPDPGHRHWSALHWMHPGLFLPIGSDTGVGMGVKDGSKSTPLTRRNIHSTNSESASQSIGVSRGDVDSMYEGAKAFMGHRGNSNGESLHTSISLSLLMASVSRYRTHRFSRVLFCQLA